MAIRPRLSTTHSWRTRCGRRPRPSRRWSTPPKALPSELKKQKRGNFAVILNLKQGESFVTTAIPVTHHRTAKVDGVSIFYREAGPADAPVVLLLHGFPTSSHMFRNLIPELADLYHVIAPDYPGYGQSDMPDYTKFAYTFDHFGDLVDGLLDQLKVARYAMYVMDYGAPVGWRLALKHPERISGLIVQNGNAYD